MYIEIINQENAKSWVYELINLYIVSRKCIESADDEDAQESYYIYVIRNGWRTKDLPNNSGYYYISETEAQRIYTDRDIKKADGKILSSTLRKKISEIVGGLHMVSTIDSIIEGISMD